MMDTGIWDLDAKIATRRGWEADTHRGLDYTAYVGAVFLVVALVFVWRSFYSMRIPKKDSAPARH